MQWQKIQNKIISNFKIISFPVFSRLIQKIFNFCSFIFIVNNLSPEIVGNYQFVISILMLCSIFSLSGMNISLLTTISRKKIGFFLEATKLSFLYSWLGSLILICFAIYFYFSNNQTMAICFVLSSLINPFFKGLLSWKTSKVSRGNFLQLAKIELINSLSLNLLLILTVMNYKNDHIFLILLFILIPSIQNIIMFFVEKNKHIIKTKKSFNSEKKYAYEYSVQEIFPLASKEIDKITIFFLLSPVNLAFYQVMIKLPEFIKNFLQEIIYFIMPRFAKLKNYSKKLASANNLLQLISGIIIIIFAFTLYPYIFKIFFNEQYHEFILMSQILLCSLGLTTDVLIKGSFISTQLKISSYKRYTISNSLIKIILSPVLIYYFNIWGALYAILIQRFFTKFYLNYLIKKYHF